LSVQDIQGPETTAAGDALLPGTRVGEFEIQRVVGTGGFGIVYLAYDHALMRSVAVKEYLPASLARRGGDNTIAVRTDQDQNTFEAGMRSFINEARLLAQFDHPALIRVFRFWEENNTAYIATPFYEGETLRALVKREPQIATERWLHELLPPLLDALETLHRGNVFHRDISPDNIVIQKNGAPVLLDFGAARCIADDRAGTVTVILKPGYAPVEQYSEELATRQGPWSDVYAVCAMLHFLITGKAPPAAVTRVVSDNYVPLHLRQEFTGYARDFLRAIDFGLAVHAEDRPQSIAELRELLNWRPEMYLRGERAAPASVAAPVAATRTPPLFRARGAEVAAAGAETPPSRPSLAPRRSAAPPLLGSERPEPEPAEMERTMILDTGRMPPADFGGSDVAFPPLTAGPRPARRPKLAQLPPSPQSGNGAKWGLALLVTAVIGAFYLQPAFSPIAGPADPPVAATHSATGSPDGSSDAAMSSAAAPAAMDRGDETAAADSPIDNGVRLSAERSAASSPDAPGTRAAAGGGAPTAPAMANASGSDLAAAQNPAAAATAHGQVRPSQTASARSVATAVATADDATATAAGNAPAASTAAAAPPAKQNHRPVAPHGYLLLDIQPAGYVSVDGIPRGTSPPLTRLELSPGSHDISIENGSVQPLETTLEITDGGSVLLAHDFAK
jgi:non-specific serine/threonine protein kinase